MPRTRRSPLRWAPNAPRRGETVETLLRRAELECGVELVRAVAERRTFSDIIVGWPLVGGDRRRLIALSAAPLFGRHREFLGYRGFGVLGEEVDAPRPQEGALGPEPAEEALLRETTALEPSPPPGAAPPADGSVAASETASPAERPFAPLIEALAPRDDGASLTSNSGPPFEDSATAAELAGEASPHDEPRAEPERQVSAAELVRTGHLEALPPPEASLAADGKRESAPALPETGVIEGAASAAQVIETRLETAPMDHFVAPPPPETSLEADGSEPAPALNDAGEAGVAQARPPSRTSLGARRRATLRRRRPSAPPRFTSSAN